MYHEEQRPPLTILGSSNIFYKSVTSGPSFVSSLIANAASGMFSFFTNTESGITHNDSENENMYYLCMHLIEFTLGLDF